MERFTFDTSLDLNMCCYHIKTDNDAQKVFTILFLWGKYNYKRLQDYLYPDVFRNFMSNIFQAMEHVITTMICFKDYLSKLDIVFFAEKV
jgi:hypothetical protein